jgi:hypothetical protein
MVLHPISSGDPDASSRQSNSGSAWEVVEKQQKENAQEWWLIAQPDHAALAGDLAALLDAPSVPDLDEPLLRAISLHDSGWAQFDGGERGTRRELEVSLRDPKTDAEGKPLSFLEMSVEEFLLAWESSIANAAHASPAGGAIVSEHFCRLTRTRLQSHSDAAQERGRLHDFLTRQRDLQATLLSRHGRPADEIAILTDVLQFCDLLSLYLCCGAEERVTFPQSFGGKSISISRKDGMYQLEPSILGNGGSLGVTARRFPQAGALEIGTLAFLIQ